MSAPCHELTWQHDDTGYIVQALAEWNFRQPAHTKPVKSFGELSASGQSWVLMRAAELKDAR